MSMKNRTLKQAGALALAMAVLGNCGGFPDTGLMTGYAAEAEEAQAGQNAAQTEQNAAQTEQNAAQAEPESVTPLAQYSAEEMAAFRDNTLEYWEIPGLIEHYNPSYLNQLETYYGNPDGTTGLSREQLINLAAELRAEASDLEDELDEMELDEDDELYQDYKSNIKTMKRYAREMEDALEGSASTRRALKIVKNQMIVELSAQMRSYQSLKTQDEIQKKNLEIARMTYDSAVRQMEQGMYSNEDVLAAADSLNAAKAAADASAASMNQAKQSLITALGWEYDSNSEILAVPEPDVAKIADYSLETDMEPAISANYDIADMRKTGASELGGVAEKQKQIREKEDQVRMQMEFLYRDVQQKQASYQAAMNGWTVAEANKAQADRKYALGMISRQEYLTAEVTWLTAKASREQAALDLTASMETYEWAVKGLMAL